MSQPFWLSAWRACDGVLSLALDAATVLPFMLGLCLILSRSAKGAFLATPARLYRALGLGCLAVGLALVAARAAVDLRFFPMSMDHLVPVPFQPFAGPWLASTTTFLLLLAAAALLWLAGGLMRPVFQNQTRGRRIRLRADLAAAAAFAAFLCCFASIVSRNWPFMGLPEGMTQQRAFEVLLSHAWRTSCASLMPAGAIAVFALQMLLARAPESAEEKEARKRGSRSGEARTPLLPQQEAQSVRMGLAFAIAGAVFQFLGASFIAFSYSAAMGQGLRSALAQYTPVCVTGLSIAGWGMLFARPRRHALFLALLPVLLVLFRACLRV